MARERRKIKYLSVFCCEMLCYIYFRKCKIRGKTVYFYRSIVIVFLSVAFLTVSAGSKEISTSRKNIQICIPIELSYAGNIKSLISKSYQETGRTIEWHLLPVNRCLVMVSEGILDADIGRSPIVTLQYPNLISVPVQLFTAKVNLYSLEPKEHPLPEPQALLSEDRYRVAYPSYVHHIKKMATGKNTLGATSAEHMISLLRKGRVDYILLGATEVEKLRENSDTLKGLHEVQDNYIDIPAYHILNQKHEALAKELADIFRKMLNAP